MKNYLQSTLSDLQKWKHTKRSRINKRSLSRVGLPAVILTFILSCAETGTGNDGWLVEMTGLGKPRRVTSIDLPGTVLPLPGGTVKAGIAGEIVSLNVLPGQQINPGAIVARLTRQGAVISIKAKITGTVLKRHAGPGDKVTAGVTLYTLAEAGTAEVQAELPVWLKQFMRTQTAVLVKLNLAGPQKTKLRQRGDRLTAAIKADPKLHFYTEALLTFNVKPMTAYRLPIKALINHRGKQTEVLVARGGVAHRLSIVVTGFSDHLVEAAGDFKPGDKLITGRIEDILPGEAVAAAGSGTAKDKEKEVSL